MSLTIFTSDRFADHRTPPGHPERVERAEVMQVVTGNWRARGGAVTEARAATDEELERVHAPEYIRSIAQTAGQAVALDPDTFTSPESYEVARLGAGAAVQAVEHVVLGRPGARALVMVRPPGHHAERDRAMGFCLFNNVAVAAAHARALGLARVAVVDYDVHHGNGTQCAFYADPSVLFVSSHQFPYYPGTGAATETGHGAGEGYTLNLPLEAGATDADYDRLFAHVVVPAILRFAPGLILVSAGFDAHQRDPLAGMRMSTDGFARLSARLVDAANACCEGRIVFVTEGGYDLHALGACLDAVIGELTSDRTEPVGDPLPGDTTRAEACLAQVRAAQAKHWPGL